ncbi:hypothetical protein [Mangrovicoccus sp. HB161399]|uniref:hypothetical protein n=1 Tax=Mangrovicoccus sp. HB161399 TaxID=2720392 RepID=UPI0020A645E8|nr:hypothetical protein [Mangrovicoccus sp. HB161399]
MTRLALLLALLPATALAQEPSGHDGAMAHDMQHHAEGMPHHGGAVGSMHAMMQGMTDGGTGPLPGMPAESGQSGFAAIAEIVAMLRADPDTDWSKVDIGALRQHLRDMDQLMTELEAEEEPLPDGLRVTVEPGTPGAAAAWRMLPAHAPMLAAETGWTSEIAEQGGSLVWTVTSPGDAAQIRGLGVYGLMAAGSHHQLHHLAIARGAARH